MTTAASYKIVVNATQAQQTVKQLSSAFTELNKTAKAPRIDSSQGVSALGRLKGAAIAATAAIAVIGVTLNKALNANANAENALLGIKSLVAALTDIRTANGEAATGAEKLAIAGEVAEKQLAALRLAGMQTSATFEQLSGAFQQAVGAGASAGLTLDQTRNLVVGITQAAGALGLPMQQLNQEVRSLISGEITANSTVARAIGITPEQVKLWRESGVLFERLNEQFQDFRNLGPETGATWTATLSNISDALTMSLQRMSKGAFDGIKRALQAGFSAAVNTETGEATTAFQNLESVGKLAFDAIGKVIVDVISGATSLAVSLGETLTGAVERLEPYTDAVSAIYENIKIILGLIAGLIGSVVKSVGGWADSSGLVVNVLQGIALILASFRDAFRLIQADSAELGAIILDKVGGALKSVLRSLQSFVSAIPGVGSSLASVLERAAAAVPENGNGLRATAAAIRADFEAGRTAVNETRAMFSARWQRDRERIRERAAGVEGSGGTSNPRARVNDENKKAADDARRKAEAEAKARLDALNANVQAQLDFARKVAQAQAQTAEVELQRSLDRQLITYEQFIDERAKLEEAARQQDLLAARTNLSRLQAALATEKPGTSNAIKIQADITKAQADVAALEERGITLKARINADKEQFQREVDALRVDIKAQLLDQNGQPLEATLARLGQERSALLNDRRVAGNPELTAGVNQLFDSRERTAQLDEQARQAGLRAAQGAAEEARIRSQMNAGLLTTLQGEQQIREVRVATAEAMRQQVEAAERLAAASNDPVQIQAARQLRAEYEELANTVDTTAKSINDSFASGLMKTVDALLEGTAKATDVLRQFVSDFLRSIAQTLLNQSVQSAIAAMGGASGGVGGAVVGALRSVLGFSRGGQVRGPGSGTSDSILARLSNGEFVLKAAAVRALGVDRLNYMNRTGQIPRFATGGLVGAGIGGGDTTVQNAINLSPRVVVQTKQIVDGLRGDSDAERWVVSVVNSNKRKLS
jgi:hypothetical protein